MREPLNSDDILYLNVANEFAKNPKQLLASVPPSTDPAASHVRLRLGLLLPVSGLIWLFGWNFKAYYIMSVAMSLLGDLALFILLQRFLNKRIAVIAILVHIFNPLVVSHATLLLPNMPTTALALVYVALITKRTSKIHDQERQTYDFLTAMICGSVLAWIYFIRFTAPAFLLPFFVVALFVRKTRNLAIISLFILCLAVMAEQVYYMARGAEFGYRFHVVNNAFNRYQPFFSHYRDAGEYIFRFVKSAGAIGGRLPM
jgi:hypothetical protein